MSDDRKQPDNTSNTSSSSSGESGSNTTGNDIPYVPPTDRTNLNESMDFDTKPFILPTPSTKSNDE